MSEQRTRPASRRMIETIVVLSIVLVAVIIISVFFLIDRNTVMKENDELTSKVEELRTQIASDADGFNAANTAIADLQSELGTVKTGNDELTAANDELHQQVDDGINQLTSANEELRMVNSQLAFYKGRLLKAVGKLVQRKESIAAAKATISQMQTTMHELTGSLAASDAKVERKDTALEESNSRVSELEDLLATSDAKIDELTSEIALLTQTPASDAAVFEADSVEVSDAVSFLEAIRPNRTIYLLPGDYDLSSDAVMEMLTGENAVLTPYVYYNDFDTNDKLNSGVVIVNVDDLTIFATDPQEIYTKSTKDTVLIFESCNHITVTGITFGHKPDKATACVAAVIGTAYCDDVVFSGCDLYGCGVQGAYLEYSSSIIFIDSVIRDCVNMAAYIYGGEDIQFIGTEIYGVGTSNIFAQTLFQISGNSKTITFKECNIHDNGNSSTTLPSTMFLVIGREDELTITDCEMNDNIYDNYIQ